MPRTARYSKRFKTTTAFAVLILAGAAAHSTPVMAQLSGSEKGVGSLFGFSLFKNVSLDANLQSGQAAGVVLSDPVVLREFYAARQNEPLWISRFGPNDNAKALLSVIEASWMQGLNPAHYHLEALKTVFEDSDKKADLELLLTDAALLYAQDMTGARVSQLRLSEEIYNAAPVETPDALLEKISEGDTTKIMADLEPKSATYKILQKALVDLSQKPEESYFSALPIRFDGVLRPGQRHKSVPQLRVRLGVAPQTDDVLLYDDALFSAVIKFQAEGHLKDDGKIGADTLAALNRTNRDRILQLIVNMERLRWMEGPRPEKFVVVNIPAATLWAINKGEVAFEMPVIVGRPERATPSLVAEITGIRFNPDWTVPPTIKKEDIVPKLVQDPNYLMDKGMELIYRSPEGIETIDPTSIDWSTISQRDLNVLEMVQIPGDHNPLGRIRVLMPNKYSIYLHDTNQRDYFNKAGRALSSGCIRLKDPVQMASFVMDGEKGWDEAKVKGAIARNTTRDMLISERFPVYILYYTAWVDSQGRVVFGRDIYGRDRKFIEMLEKTDGLFIAADNSVSGSEQSKLVSAK